MKKNQILNSILMALLLTLTFMSCADEPICDSVTCPTGYICDEGECIVDPNAITEDEIEIVSGFIASNTTWTADKIWELAGKVIVDNGATLTIEPGTIIKGRTGAGSLASALVVARGGTINAVGTVDKPIIFTSVLDNIKVGEKTGTNLSETDHSKWGGLIVLGKAKVSVKVGDTEGQIEGIPADESYGKYGGDDDADNSGTLAYISIRHGGALIGEGNEINGLTLGGVGTGTSIHHVEVIANLDDGIECFGGSVNIDYALVAYQGDDAFDVDQNYSGTFDNSMVVYDNSGDEFLEIDGPENATHASGKFTFSNCTFVSTTADGTADLKSKAQGTITNCKFEGLSKFKVSAKFEDDCTTMKTDAYSHYISGDLVVTNNNTDAPIIAYTKSDDANGTACTISTEVQDAATDIFNNAGNNSNATGADESAFEGWTWMSLNSKI